MTTTLPFSMSAHTACLGMSGSGKTSSMKVLIERDYQAGLPVCVLDPVKSDFAGIKKNAAGEDGKGLPFKIFGGPAADLPLYADDGAKLAELVATRRVKYSVIDMSDFDDDERGQFYCDFVERLMQLKKDDRKPLRLVLEEADSFAPKGASAAKGKSGNINYWSGRLAKQGRSIGIRLLVGCQATQNLHNNVLSNCGVVLAHRTMGKSALATLAEWISASADAKTADAVLRTLPGLKAGECWACTNDSTNPVRFQFPRIKTYNNSATPEMDETDDTPEMSVHEISRFMGGQEAIEEVEEVELPPEWRLSRYRDSARKAGRRFTCEEGLAAFGGNAKKYEKHVRDSASMGFISAAEERALLGVEPTRVKVSESVMRRLLRWATA